MCPLKETCGFYNNKPNNKLSDHEVGLMKKVFCDSELFLLNKDCKIFLYKARQNAVRPRPMHMSPLG
ncbi:MAG: hypothetical protein HPY53_00640 [Brevinematales bacterium]|nr:hypothetical protein [Brevinematales bacterium]